MRRAWLLRGARRDRAQSRPRSSSSGQALVELAIGVPVFMILLLGMLEFGFIFTHHLALEYATREGARMGSALAAGTDQIPCADVDKNVMAALQRVVTSPGSQVNLANISRVQIYKADAAGQPIGGLINTWTPGTGPTVDGLALRFQESSTGWAACSRNNGTNPDSVGVRLSYTYDFVTPLGNFVAAFGTGRLPISDQTVMALNPT